MDKKELHQNFLIFIWKNQLFNTTNLQTKSGQKIVVLNSGSLTDPTYPNVSNTHNPEFENAKIIIGDTTYIGSIVIHVNSSDWATHKHNQDHSYNGVILNIVENDDRIVRKIDDSVLHTLAITYSEKLLKKYLLLVSDQDRYICSDYLNNSISEIEKNNEFTRLLIERLERKCQDIMKTYQSVDNSWYETFNITLFGTMSMGDSCVKEIYTLLAQNITYSKLCQERGNIENIEAMIFGVAALLDNKPEGSYKETLCEKFKFLRIKHNLKILEHHPQTGKQVRPFNYSHRRLAELAQIINTNKFTFENVLKCENIADIKNLLYIEKNDFWRRRYNFNTHSTITSKHLFDKSKDLIIINQIVPLMFAYGMQTEDNILKERALDFLYAIESESNKYTRAWCYKEVKIESAFYSQAFIQLSKEYCSKSRCVECFIGIKLLKNI